MSATSHFQRVKTLYAYACPDCDSWFKKIQAREDRDGLIKIRCPDCGFLEQFYGVNA